MTKEEIIVSIVIGICTGIMSGLLTGWVITKYYREVDEKNAVKENFVRYLNSCGQYLRDIQTEIELMERGKLDARQLKRTLANLPQRQEYPKLDSEIQKEVKTFLMGMFNITSQIEARLYIDDLPSNESKSEIQMLIFQLFSLVAKI